MVRPVLEGFPDAHLWSIGATEGTQSIRLDTLDEGHTRLLACTAASPSRPGASRQHLAAWLQTPRLCSLRGHHMTGAERGHHIDLQNLPILIMESI